MKRQIRYSTETVTLKKKTEDQIIKEQLSMHFKKKNGNIQTDTSRYSSKVSREHSIGINQQSHKQLQLKKKKINNERGTVEPVRLDTNLFGDQERAFEYEGSFAKKLKLGPLSPEIQSYVNELHQELGEMNSLNSETYQKICSYLRNPFTSCQQGSFHIDIVKSMSLTSLVQCFQRIMPLHKKCKTEGGLCLHLVGFRKKITLFMSQFSS